MVMVMNYLTSRTSGEGDAYDSSAIGTLLMLSNPILEAFGNATTVRGSMKYISSRSTW